MGVVDGILVFAFFIVLLFSSAVVVRDVDGTILPVQLDREHPEYTCARVLVRMPPLSFLLLGVQYFAEAVSAKTPYTQPLAESIVLENEFLRVSFSPEGNLEHVESKTGRSIADWGRGLGLMKRKTHSSICCRWSDSHGA